MKFRQILALFLLLPWFSSILPAETDQKGPLYPLFTSVCERTPQVRDAIVAQLGIPCEKINLDDLNKIKELDLSEEGIRRLHKTDFGGLFSLEVLDLSGNELRSLPEKMFYDICNIRELDLSRNFLGEITDLVLNESHYSLRELHIHDNSLSSLTLRGFPHLQLLDASNNALMRELSLDELPQLRSLSLANTKLFSIEYLQLERFSTLKKLDLSFNYLDEVPGLEKLAQLKDLDLSDNQIKIFPEELLYREGEWLDLSNNQINRLPKTVSQDKIRLQYISLSENPFFSIPRWLRKRDKKFDITYNADSVCLRAMRYLLEIARPSRQLFRIQ